MSTIVERPTVQAKAIMINDRYFHAFGKKGQVQTAWSAAGAMLFMCTYTMNPVIKKLAEKRKKYRLVNIDIREPHGFPIKELYQQHSRLQRTINNIKDIGSKVGYSNVGKNVRTLTVSILLLEKDYPSQDVRRLMYLSSNNAYPNLGRVSLSTRLREYRLQKLANVRADKFCEDIPF